MPGPSRGAVTRPLAKCLSLLVPLAVALVGLPAPASAATGAPTPSAGPPGLSLKPLSDALRPDGTLEPGTQGSLDASGYSLRSGEDGEPTFVPKAAAAAAAPTALPGSWSTTFGGPLLSNDLHAVAVSGSEVYIGGSFYYTMAGMPNGTYNRIARWDGSGWKRMGSGMNDAVRAIAVVGGSVFAGGDFTAAGGVETQHLARWNGSSWSAVGGGVTDPTVDYGTTVNALASDGTKLYVGGTFRKAGSVNASSLAAYTISSGTWAQLGGGTKRCADCGVDDPGTVNALALRGSRLYVGGSFDQVGSTRTNSFAAVDTGSGAWTAFGSGVTDDGYKGTVNSLGIDPTTGNVYVGGSFTHAGSVQSWNLAKLSGSTFSTLGSFSSYGGKYAEVYSVAFSGGKLYAGGSFTAVGGLSAQNFVVHDGSSWSVPGQPLDNVVRVLAPKGSGVVVLGDFDNAGTLRVQHGGVWTGSAWQLFGQGVTSTHFNDGEVHAVLPNGTGAYVAGQFDQAGSVEVGSIARWTGSGWDTMQGGVTSAIGSGRIFAMQQVGGDLYVAGSFDRAGNVAAKNIAKWNGSTWSAVGSGTDSNVNALALLGGKLYVAGKFSTAGGLLVGGLAKVDVMTGAWSKVGQGPLFDHDINALAVIDGRYLVIGGVFNGFNHQGVKIVESLYGMTMFDTLAPQDPTKVLSGYLLLEGVSRYGAPGWVNSLHVLGGDLYVGGWFDKAGLMLAVREGKDYGFAASNLAVWHFSAENSPWEPLGGPDEQVRSMTTANGKLAVGGWFTQLDGGAANRVAQYDPATGSWGRLDLGLDQGRDDYSTANALAYNASTSSLWVGGSFDQVGSSTPSANIGVWNLPATAPVKHTLTVAKAGTGTVSSSPAGISCGTDCTEAYAAGTSVTLTATAASGSKPTGWSGACTGTGSTCTVTMSAARSVTATFAPVTTTPTPVGAGTYQETASAITYTGTWATSNSKDDGGAVRYTTNAPATASITFTGTSITWKGRKGTSSGIAKVYLDGTLATTLDLYGTTSLYQQALFTRTGLSSGTHTLRIEHSGTRNAKATDDVITLDALVVGSGTTPAPVGKGTYQETASAITYTGTWATSNSKDDGGAVRYTTNAPATASITFTGSSITWKGRKGTSSGIAKVYLDGTLATTLDLYGTTSLYQQALFTRTGLSSGTHTLRIEHSGTRNAKATDDVITLDALTVG